MTLTLNGLETCTATTDATGTATCSITPSEAAGTYSLTGSFAGDSTLPLQLTPAKGTANFVVTLEETSLSYTGPVTAQNGQPYTFSGVLATDDPASGTGINGKTVVFTLGTGSSAQTCPGTTNATGTATCTITVAGQSPGPIPVTASFTSDGYYRTASAASTVNLPEGTQLTISPAVGTYNGSTPVSGTLINTYTNQPVPNEPVTFTRERRRQSCTAVTNANGVATCSVTPTEPQGSYSLSGTFPGDSTSMPQLNPTSSSSTLTCDAGPDDLHLHRHHHGDQRPVGHPLGRADDQRALFGHRRLGPDRHPHARLGQLLAELHGGDQRQRGRQLHDRQREPEHRHRSESRPPSAVTPTTSRRRPPPPPRSTRRPR